MKALSETAQALHLNNITVRITIDRLKSLHFPCILHWKQNHFVVLYKVKKGERFCIADPGKGLVAYENKHLARCLYICKELEILLKMNYKFHVLDSLRRI